MPKDNLEPIGVEAVAAGVDQFLSKMKAMEAAYDRVQATSGKFVSAANRGGGATQKLNGTMGALSSSLSGASTSFGSLVKAGAGLAVGMAAVNTALGAVGSAVNLVTGAIKGAISTLASFTAGGMQLAGTFQEMEFSALAVGRTMGMQRSEIDGAIKDINALGIRYDVAAKTVAQFARNQIDLAQSQDLVRIAQGAAILIGEDSSATMERLTWAVTTQNTMMLRRMGIMTDLQAAEERHATSIGKTADELTNAEKVQSAVNEIIASGAGLLDVYDAAMESPTKRLRSLTGRILPEFQAALGAPFLNAWSTVIKAISKFVESLSGAISEGGALYPVMINLGAAASLLADGFSSALGTITGSIDNMRVGVNERLGSMMSDMFNWGVNLVASFAEGLAHAIEAYVVPIIQSLANMLSGWFAPGSPPKILPKIDTWGAETINEWLGGMSKADFGALKKIQGVLKQALGPETFQAASAMAMKALSGDEGALGALTQGITEGAHDKLAGYTDEIARLVQLEVQLAQAEERAAAANRQLSSTQDKLAVAAGEYNKMLAEGASPEALAGKKKEIQAMEAGLEVARQQRDEAQAGLGTLEDEAALQEDKVGAIISLMDEQQKAAKAGAGIGAMGRIAAPKMPKMDDLAKDLSEGMSSLGDSIQAGTWDITSGIGDAIEAAKGRLKERVNNMFEELKTRFSEAVAPLTTVFEEQLLPELNRVWALIKDKVGDAIESASQYWTETLQPALQAGLDETWRVVKDELKKWGDLFWTWLTDTAIPQAKEKLGKVADAIAKAWPVVKARLTEWGEKFWSWLTEVAIPKAKETLDKVADAIAKAWPAIKEKMTDWGEKFWFWLTDAANLVSEKMDVFGQAIGDQWPAISAKLTEWGELFWTWLTDTAIPQAGEKMNALADAILDWSETPAAKAIGEAIGRVLVDGIIGVLGSLYFTALMVDAFKSIPGKVAGATANMGASIGEGFVKAIGEKLKIDLPALFADIISRLGIARGEDAEEAGRILAEALAAGFRSALETAMSAINPAAFLSKSFSEAIDALRDIKDVLGDVQPPAFLNPGSPTPFEIGLLGIATTLAGSVQSGLAMVNQSVLTLHVTAMATIQGILSGLSNLLLTGILPIDRALQAIRDQTIPSLLSTVINASTQTIGQMGMVRTAVQAVTAAINAATAAFATLGSTATSIAEAIDEAMGDAEEAIEELKKAVDKATEAFEEMQKAAEAAASAAQEAGNNAVDAGAGPGFQRGTGPRGFVVPSGYPNDSFPIRVSSGERVFVQPRINMQHTTPHNHVYYVTLNTRQAEPSGILQQFEILRALTGA